VPDIQLGWNALHRSAAGAPAPAGRVVHWVGGLTDEVYSFLGPATEALAERGMAQTVIAFEDASSRRLRPLFSDAVQVVLVGPSGGPVRDWLHSLRAVREAVLSRQVTAIHLHGLRPSLGSTLLAPALHRGVQLYCTPHASKALSAPAYATALWRFVSRRVWRRSSQRIIATMAGEFRALAATTRNAVDLVESPIADVFFEAPHREAPDPLVVTGARTPNQRCARLLAQLAVLLNDQSLRLEFDWIGALDPSSALRLKAAGVQVIEAGGDAERAARLGAGWIYLAGDGMRGFPVFLAEAMALGLPCVAFDSAYHRDLIRHGETGFLYRNGEQVLYHMARLLDSAALRARIGAAAREEALRRFRGEPFRQSLFCAYGLDLESP